MRILIAFSSLSGNTRDLARQVRARCEQDGHAVSWIEAGVHGLADAGDPRHDLYLLGSWTDNGGRTPAEMKALVAELVQAVGKPAALAVFGTGETQWGREYYCGAVRRIAAFFATALPSLAIEQMPQGQHDTAAIAQWTGHILDSIKSTPHADPARPLG
jgi:flavodoxin I